MNLKILEALKSILIASVFSFIAKTGSSQPIPERDLYLGQTPPGDTPKIFPLQVKQGFFAAERIAISDNGMDIYYSEIKGYYPNTGESIKKYCYSDGKWSSPVTLFEGYAAPALSVTGDTMYVETNFETYFSVKNGSGWTKPERILRELDSAHYYQVTRNGNYYISSKSGKGAGLSDWCKVMIKGDDTSLISLGRPLNTSGEDLDFFVSQDEKFMIVTNRYMFYSTGTKPDYSDVYTYWIRIDGIIDSLKQTIEKE